MTQQAMQLQIVSLRSGMESHPESCLDVSLQAGEHLVLSGRSGAGKSSALKVLAGLIPPESGHFSWQGSRIEPANLIWWRQQCCYLPQAPVMGAESLGEALRLPWRLRAANGSVPKEETCLEMLAVLDLPHDLNKQVSELSGGEQQRVAIARALLMSRPIWLMDEPTSALDHRSREKVMAALHRQQMTCVSVSHDAAWIERADQHREMGKHHE
ncbi:ATP-binding cassette domain-containing protein (plasmid) [Photobacterium sp. GJ3]|uniref:ABC transporter ATP-binding protein n=1 Tax=Photobacterium sp. GJ3 TaxID=2829502 RepID=UPI001B8B6974|nr:ATP-binding cassette domain-containing protein [Photobacterium sp. GJ3]QUJ69929.1 ATP-binding cassette domain-containing protein [Photobacterium sp. GJ3]